MTESIEIRILNSIIDLKENMDRNFILVREDISNINKKLAEHDKGFDRIEKRLDEHDRRFEKIEKKLDEHDRRFEKIEKKLEEHDRRFDRIEKKLLEHDKRFEKHDKYFKENRHDHKEIKDSIHLLHGRANNLRTRIDKLDSNLEVVQFKQS